MRALVGAILGIVVGTLVTAGLGVAFGGNAFWSVLLAGLAAGLVMRTATSGKGSSYLKGGLAAVATVLATVAGPLVATEMIRSNTDKMKPKTAAAAVADADDEDEDSEAAADIAVAEPIAIPGVSDSRSAGLGGLNQQVPNSFSLAEVTCLVVGSLLAYVVGGGGTHPIAATSEAAPNDEPEADGQAPEEKA